MSPIYSFVYTLLKLMLKDSKNIGIPIKFVEQLTDKVV